MATPIAPTPILTGKAAKRFLREIANPQKASKEKLAEIERRASEIEKIVKCDF